MAITTLSPEHAYAFAPSIASEIVWTEHAEGEVVDEDFPIIRRWWLRNAAALDRIALADPSPAAIEKADAAAAHVLDIDHAPRDQDARAYVRHAYHAWRRADLIATGRCPNCAWLTYQCACADHPDA
ncbi:hypothetical protein [Streptomyces buecherae]|uniref:Uncharacterized protein n=1 Tax=Streptomyces buecherae TaxID=2763006 RepID=A0A7H8NB41_9ACTN|nr:hypothetical protein [Streptomyces buecherae]QKW50948.1 hypothetical protein HUT08_16995 [Streptomyces buecherae]